MKSIRVLFISGNKFLESIATEPERKQKSCNSSRQLVKNCYGYFCYKYNFFVAFSSFKGVLLNFSLGNLREFFHVTPRRDTVNFKKKRVFFFILLFPAEHRSFAYWLRSFAVRIEIEYITKQGEKLSQFYFT